MLWLGLSSLAFHWLPADSDSLVCHLHWTATAAAADTRTLTHSREQTEILKRVFSIEYLISALHNCYKRGKLWVPDQSVFICSSAIEERVSSVLMIMNSLNMAKPLYWCFLLVFLLFSVFLSENQLVRSDDNVDEPFQESDDDNLLTKIKCKVKCDDFCALKINFFSPIFYFIRLATSTST